MCVRACVRANPKHNKKGGGVLSIFSVKPFTEKNHTLAAETAAIFPVRFITVSEDLHKGVCPMAVQQMELQSVFNQIHRVFTVPGS